MMPGMDMGKLKKLMKDMEKIDAERVIIEKQGSKIIIEDPQITKMNVMGNETFQIMGKSQEIKEETRSYSDDDVTMVIERTGVDEETAKETLIKNQGDLAKTLIDLEN